METSVYGTLFAGVNVMQFKLATCGAKAKSVDP
jgi:hypothetical protein